MNNKNSKNLISTNYANAVKRVEKRKQSAEKKCSCSSSPLLMHPAEFAAKNAGYSNDEKNRYQQASESSFGCGNPLAFVSVKKGETVVDLGSGAGFDLLIAAEKVGAEGKVIGVDMTDEMLAIARKNADASDMAERIELKKGEIDNLPLENESVDWVISNCVINLATDKEKVFTEIARVLKPGGRFSVSDIVSRSLSAALRKHAAAYSGCIAGSVSEEEYIGTIEKAGLININIQERTMYDFSEIKGLISANNEIDTQLLKEIKEAEGNVWSAKIVGEKGTNKDESTKKQNTIA